MKKIKNEYFSNNPGFLGYNVNISFPTGKLARFQISVQKGVGPKKRRLCLRRFVNTMKFWTNDRLRVIFCGMILVLSDSPGISLIERKTTYSQKNILIVISIDFNFLIYSGLFETR